MRPDHDRGLPRRAAHRPPQAAAQFQPAARSAVAEARVGAAPRPQDRARAHRGRRQRRAGTARRGRGAPRRAGAARGRRRVDRGLFPVLVPEPVPRTARGRDHRRGSPGDRALAQPRGRPAVPRVRAILDHLPQRLRRTQERALPRKLRPGAARRGHDRRAAPMQSSGGCATLDAAKRRVVTLLMSGPVGGLLGGIWVGATAGFSSVISLDVGGTSADIGVAPGGEIRFKHLLDTRIGAYHAMVPMAEVDTIGAGGGSIAYVDSGGQFQVGPRSAGADPGPCCYGKGGGEPTATDCELVLGRIDPAGFLGGRLKLDAALAHCAVEAKLARPLGMSVEEAALAAIRILTHGMVQAIELNSVRRGYDPREFALVAFGGAGPLFGCDIARELSIPVVIVPPAPGLTSALGLLTCDIAYDFSATQIQNLSHPDFERLAATVSELEARALEQ